MTLQNSAKSSSKQYQQNRLTTLITTLAFCNIGKTFEPFYCSTYKYINFYKNEKKEREKPKEGEMEREGSAANVLLPKI